MSIEQILSNTDDIKNISMPVQIIFFLNPFLEALISKIKQNKIEETKQNKTKSNQNKPKQNKNTQHKTQQTKKTHNKTQQN